jgi:hypothetical protein
MGLMAGRPTRKRLSSMGASGGRNSQTAKPCPFAFGVRCSERNTRYS